MSDLFDIRFEPPALPVSGSAYLLLTMDLRLEGVGREIDRHGQRRISESLTTDLFQGRKGEILDLGSTGGRTPLRVVLVGLGRRDEIQGRTWEHAGSVIAQDAARQRASSVTVLTEGLLPSVREAALEGMRRLTLTIALESYRFAGYQSGPAESASGRIETLIVQSPFSEEAAKGLRALNAVRQGVHFARDLVSTPPNRMTPADAADAFRGLEAFGASVVVHGDEDLAQMGFRAHLAVARGSDAPARLVIARWNGAPEIDQKPVVIVGKGVTFDSGGLWLKAGPIMELMKFDMAGAAAVAGLMRACAERGARANVIGIAALAENMVDGRSYRPGDVIESLSGQSIEIVNTDAEGRVLLSDALWYAATQLRPRCLIDLATLTGAMVTALGSHYAGLFSNDDALADELTRCGEREGERLWRFPLAPEYDRQIDSDVADMRNIPKPGFMGLLEGAPIAAAQFLQRFVDGVRWAHLDIAGTGWATVRRPGIPVGASGFGVRLLDRFVSASAEAPRR